MTIGLFGTCGNSKWRDVFMKTYDALDINYFNPVKDNWCEDDAKVEADHLANDEIILFPVTDETTGLGSLGEVGFSILQAIRFDDQRDVIVMIDDKLNDEAKAFCDDPKIVSESVKMRALVNAHLRKLKYPNVYIVDNLTDMLSLSLLLKDISDIKESTKQYTINQSS